jgi:hypothetical protein
MNTRNKKKLANVLTIDSLAAWHRCRGCEWLGIGKNAGRCMARRIGSDHMPIEQVFSCPIGREVAE